jgi:hypothetical protein
MEVYPKIPGTRISPVGGQPPGRSCVESLRGVGSYKIFQINRIVFSLFDVGQAMLVYLKKRAERFFSP